MDDAVALSTLFERLRGETTEGSAFLLAGLCLRRRGRANGGRRDRDDQPPKHPLMPNQTSLEHTGHKTGRYAPRNQHFVIERRWRAGPRPEVVG